MFSKKVNRIMALLKQGGASDVIVVGGSVRDQLLGIPSKDTDMEVYGLNYAQIAAILRPHFHINLVGQSFGALKVDNSIDVVLPRRESKQGSGHKGFEVQSNPNLDLMAAFARRDFTINAIGRRQDGTLVDPYHGVDDLEKKILRATSPAFKDDPLRVLRAMQFASRFGFTLERQTIIWCREVFSEFATLSEERIYMEWKKWATRGKYPSLGLNVLLQTGWIQGFPELAALVGCEQTPQWHQEGDVWEHTKLVCDMMADQITQAANGPEPFTQEEHAVLMFAALGHDFGKPGTSQMCDGVIRSHGHAEAGVPLMESFLQRMKAPIRITETTKPLVREHMAFFGTTQPTPRSVRRLACRLTPANIRLWGMLCRADILGSKSENGGSPMPVEHWLKLAAETNVRDKRPRPVLQGRDLIPLGIAPGVQMGEILNIAFEAQLDGEFENIESGIEFLKQQGLIPSDS